MTLAAGLAHKDAHTAAAATAAVVVAAAAAAAAGSIAGQSGRFWPISCRVTTRLAIN